MMELLSVGLDQLMPDPTQPRKTFDADALGRLAASSNPCGSCGTPTGNPG